MEHSFDYWAKRIGGPVLVIIGVIVYRTYSHKSNPPDLTAPELSSIKLIIDKKNVIVGKTGRVKTVLWDSLSEFDLRRVFRIPHFRSLFEEATKESGIDLNNELAIRALGGRWRKLYNVYTDTTIYTWRGEEVTKKQYKDSLSSEYNTFTDSLSRNSNNR